MIPHRQMDRLRALLYMHSGAAQVYYGYLKMPETTLGIPGEMTEDLTQNFQMNVLRAIDMLDRLQAQVSGCLDEIAQMLGDIPNVRKDILDYVLRATDTQDVNYNPKADVQTNFASTYDASRMYGGLMTILFQYMEPETR